MRLNNWKAGRCQQSRKASFYTQPNHLRLVLCLWEFVAMDVIVHPWFLSVSKSPRYFFDQKCNRFQRWHTHKKNDIQRWLCDWHPKVFLGTRGSSLSLSLFTQLFCCIYCTSRCLNLFVRNTATLLTVYLSVFSLLNWWLAPFVLALWNAACSSLSRLLLCKSPMSVSDTGQSLHWWGSFICAPWNLPSNPKKYSYRSYSDRSTPLTLLLVSQPY